MLEEKLVELLKEKGYFISTAESCTGGLIAATIINVAGASDVYKEGFITYANEAKRKYLGVKESTLNQFGAVSQETVLEMAEGCAKQTGAEVTVVTSGVAGPGGGTEELPVGSVWFCCYYNGTMRTEKQIFSGNRAAVRNKATEYAIKFVLDTIKD